LLLAALACALPCAGGDPSPTLEEQMDRGRALIRRPGSKVKKKKLAEAERLFGALVDAGHNEARLELAETLLRGGRDDEAAAVLEAYLGEAAPGSREVRARVLLARPYCGRESCLPEFEATSLDGRTWDTAALRGRAVLVEFWATWCAPCIDAVPHLRQLHQAYADAPFLMLGVSIDSDPETLIAFLRTHSVDWSQVADTRAELTHGTFGVRNFPTYVVLDHRGVVVRQISGWGSAVATELDAAVRDAVADAQKAANQR
jgi:thiol-disulfide isomerase/thioredoxin